MQIRFIVKNAGWSVLNPVKAREAVRAMSEYRKRNPVCEITGSKNRVQVHHIIPVWANPDLAADQENMISLSASAHIHLIFGHGGNFAQRYVSNIKTVAAMIRDAKSKSEIVSRRNTTSPISFFINRVNTVYETCTIPVKKTNKSIRSLNWATKLVSVCCKLLT